MLSHLLAGLAALGSPQVAGLLLVGVLVGVFMGVLPGLGVSMVLSIMLAFIYHMKVDSAVALMLATQAGSYFSASVTAILLNTPGAPESMATTFDGFPMAKRGRAGEALGVSATATCIGGLVGCAGLIGLIQIVNDLPGLFHPPEYVALITLAVVLTGSLGTNSITKALLSAGVGLMISFIGSDPVTGIPRFTLGNPLLYGGISVVALALGIFAVPQMVFMYGVNKSVTSRAAGEISEGYTRQVVQGIRETLRHWLLLVRSALIGVACGIIPGIGGFAANFLSYGVAQQTSKRRKKFGTGIPEGIIAPEGSSLAKEAGSLVPAIGLGLPSGLGMVLFLAALAILGLQPGPGFLRSHPDLPYTMMWTVAIGGVVGTVLGLLAVPVLARITRVRGPLLLPFIVALAVVGAYASDTSMATVVELLVFAVVGIVMRRLRYSLSALAVGLVLGSQLEDQIYLTHQIFGMSFVKRPLADILFLIALAVIVVQAIRLRRISRGAEATSDAANELSEEVPNEHRLLDLIVVALLTVFAAAYILTAMGYSFTARLTPMIVGAVVLLVGLIRVVTVLIQWVRGRRPERPPAAAEEPALTGPAAPPEPALTGPGAAPRHASSSEAAPAQPAGDAEETDLVGTAQPVATGRTEPAPAALRWLPASGASRVYVRELVALAWVVGLVLSCYLIGFIYGVPLVVLLYGLFGVRYSGLFRRIAFSVASTAVMGAVTYAIFYVLALSYPGLLIH